MRFVLRVCVGRRQVAVAETKYERAKAVISAVAINGGSEQCLAREGGRSIQIAHFPFKAMCEQISNVYAFINGHRKLLRNSTFSNPG